MLAESVEIVPILPLFDSHIQSICRLDGVRPHDRNSHSISCRQLTCGKVAANGCLSTRPIPVQAARRLEAQKNAVAQPTTASSVSDVIFAVG
jgi:hypothetical protein